MFEIKYFQVCPDVQKSFVLRLVTHHPISMQKIMVIIYAGTMRANLFCAYETILQSRLIKLYVTKNPVIVKKALTAVLPVTGNTCPFSVSVQKCERISAIAKKNRRKSKQFSLRISRDMYSFSNSNVVS